MLISIDSGLLRVTILYIIGIQLFFNAAELCGEAKKRRQWEDMLLWNKSKCDCPKAEKCFVHSPDLERGIFSVITLAIWRNAKQHGRNWLQRIVFPAGTAMWRDSTFGGNDKRWRALQIPLYRKS